MMKISFELLRYKLYMSLAHVNFSVHLSHYLFTRMLIWLSLLKGIILFAPLQQIGKVSAF